MTRQLGLAGTFLALLGAFFACTHNPPPPPNRTPGGPSDNPEDVRARMPYRPTPPQPESKFPPPQQSAEEEEREANKANEPDLLHVQPSIRLDGAPFPKKITYEPGLVEAKRLRYVSGEAAAGGDGSAEHPWNDLQEALCQLVPGDRLLLTPAIYEGSFRVGSSCHGGTADAPIQVFARHAFLKPRGDGDVLTVEQPYWQFWEVQIALLHSRVAGFVTRGPGAHDIAVDQSHIYEGKGPAVKLAAGSSRITISNSHIHQSGGIQIEAATRDITITTSHIHHNFGTSVTIGADAGAGAGPAENVQIVGNRLQNDHGSALRILHSHGARILHNVFANYRPDEESEFNGTAIFVGSGSSDVQIEGNSILEASIGIAVGEARPAGAAPEKVVILRNFLQNTLTPEGVALDVVRGTDIRFYNSVVDRYTDDVHAADGVRALSVANNLFLGGKTACVLLVPGANYFFDYNVFANSTNPRVVLGSDVYGVSDLTAGPMSHTRIFPKVEISGGDLAKLTGFSPVDQGQVMPGLSYRGAAPDIGIAER
jgi:hypothetical protein